MDLSKYQAMQFRRDGRILHVTLNRPEGLNAFTGELHDEFQEFIARVPQDEASDVLVITGAGKAFSAGGDIGDMQELIKDPASFHPKIPHIKRLVTDLLDIPQVVITKVNGAAMGLGATIALLGDICFAANHAKIADPHVKVGFVA
ncbi:MAG: enoyl-CoA hydratase/isomerase family protein, partial [Prolixibacteraceae bacterium]|nr:enoyl-CoA hydratase/isomerase family protein [Burkholderiales bacterium]